MADGALLSRLGNAFYQTVGTDTHPMLLAPDWDDAITEPEAVSPASADYTLQGTLAPRHYHGAIIRDGRIVVRFK